MPDLDGNNLNWYKITSVCSTSTDIIKQELTNFVQEKVKSFTDYKAKTIKVDIELRTIQVSGLSEEKSYGLVEYLNTSFLEYIIVDK